MKKGPETSIIITNHNGKRYLADCLRSLQALDYPEGMREVIVVDNGSIDGSQRFLQKNFPSTRIISNKANLGYASACNQGARQARGRYLAFLNNDMRVDRQWLSSLLKEIRSDVVCTTSKVLNWKGTRLDYGGAVLNFQAIGKKRGAGEHPDRFNQKKEVIFPYGGALAIRRDVFLSCGGFDEDYFAFYEDIDLGWRLWILGYRILYVSTSIVYHHGGGTSSQFNPSTLRVLQLRNPLYTVLKNYEHIHLEKYLLFALLLSLHRTLLIGELDDHHFRPPAHPKYTLKTRICSPLRHLRGDTKKIPSLLKGDLLAYQDLIQNFPRMLKKREQIQKKRKRADEDIFALFGEPLWVVEKNHHYREFQKTLENFLQIK